MTATPYRRQFGRRRTHEHGWVRIAGRPPLPCLVTNLSEKGAFLTFEPPSWMPLQFELLLATGGAPRLCELRHVRQEGGGVAFAAALEPEAAEPVQTALDYTVDEWVGLRRPAARLRR